MIIPTYKTLEAIQEIINDRDEQIRTLDTENDEMTARLVRLDRRDWQMKYDALYADWISY